MYTDGDVHMSFDFDEEFRLLRGIPKWVLYLFWWVQAFGLLYFDSMLFFGLF